MSQCIISFFPAPDVPDFLGRYSMVDGTDYAEQTSDVIELLTPVMRIVCYNQSIYDDTRLEVSEYAGLTLGVSEATVLTVVQPMYDYIAICIQDNDGKLYLQ